LTTKRGDSGSAGLLDEKCVIIEAPNLDTKSDQNLSPTWKMIKNQQKSTKCKNRKNDKIRKSEKVTKSRKQKSDKMIKMENQKSDQKKWQKLTPPEKGQNVT